MIRLLYLLPLLSVLVVSSCTKKEEIPSNTNPPTVSLVADTIAVSNGKYILKAQGQSTYGGPKLTKVEFFKGTEKIGEKAIAPYTFEYQVTEITPDEELSFRAILIDEAGNKVESNTIKSKVKVLPIRIEAENATLTGVAAIANDQATKETASNQAKVGKIDNAASGIDATIEIKTAGIYLIRVAAGSGLAGASHKVYVDDKTTEAQVYNIANKGWNIWQTFDLRFTLETGTHKVSIRRNAGFAELDYFEYSKQ